MVNIIVLKLMDLGEGIPKIKKNQVPKKRWVTSIEIHQKNWILHELNKYNEVYLTDSVGRRGQGLVWCRLWYVWLFPGCYSNRNTVYWGKRNYIGTWVGIQRIDNQGEANWLRDKKSPCQLSQTIRKRPQFPARGQNDITGGSVGYHGEFAL